MPWIAFVPLISGVCSVFGTFEMTSKPTKAASTRIASSVSRSIRCPHGCFAPSCTISPSRVTQAPCDDLVLEVELERAVLAGHQLEQRRTLRA